MMWSIKLSSAPSDINSSSLEDILSVISQPTIFRAHKAWIFWMSSINSNYFGQGRVQRQFWHISNHQNHYFISILYQLQEDYSKQLPKIPVQNDWFHCSTILRCYPFTFLCKLMQSRENGISRYQCTADTKTGHQGDRQALCHLPRVLGWTVLHRLVQAGLLFTFKTLYCFHKKSFELCLAWRRGRAMSQRMLPTIPTQILWSKTTLHHGTGKRAPTGKQVWFNIV